MYKSILWFILLIFVAYRMFRLLYRAFFINLLKYIKYEKKKLMVCSPLFLMAIIGVWWYVNNENLQMTDLMRANVEAITQDESDLILKSYKMDRVTKEIKITYNVEVGATLNGTTITQADIEVGFYRAEISCCVSTLLWWMECPFSKQNKDC